MVYVRVIDGATRGAADNMGSVLLVSRLENGLVVCLSGESH